MRTDILIILLSLPLLFTGCQKPPDYPVTPVISFKKIDKFTVFSDNTQNYLDSLIITIFFQDGDGDLGLDDSDLAKAPYKDNYNYLVDVYKKVNGTFELETPQHPYSGNFPPLYPKDKKGPIDGELNWRITFPYFNSLKPNTIYKFQIRIRDRAMNESNTIETSEVVIREK